jgi:hypothetical protein
MALGQHIHGRFDHLLWIGFLAIKRDHPSRDEIAEVLQFDRQVHIVHDHVGWHLKN